MGENKFKKMPVGYGMVQTAVMKMQGLSIQAKAIYSLLASYTGSKDFCFPTIETIGNDVDLSRPMVTKYIKELEKVGLIKKTKLYPNNKMKTHNRYEVMYLESSRCKADLTSDVKPTLHRELNTLNTRCKADLTQNSIIYNNNIITPDKSQVLTPPTEESTPFQDTDEEIDNLPQNNKGEWFMVPDKMKYEFLELESIEFLNQSDDKIIAFLTTYLEDDEKRENLEADLEKVFKLAKKEKVSNSLMKKLKNISYILEKFTLDQFLKGFEITQKNGKEKKLSYLRKVLEKAFMPGVYKKSKEVKV